MASPSPAAARPDGTFRISPDVIAQRLGDSVILVHMETDKIFELNRTGARLWELLTSGNTPAQAQLQMLREFDVDQPQLAQETAAILSSLLAERLVSIA